MLFKQNLITLFLILPLTVFFSNLLNPSCFASTDREYIEKFWPSDQAQILIRNKTDRYYDGKDGTRNYYAQFSFPDNLRDNALIIVTGVEDPVPLWFDTVLKSHKRGFKFVYIIELRGQGKSERVPGNDGGLIHVNNFADYYEDFIFALKDINKKNIFNKPVYIISHSAGSLVVGNSLGRISDEIPNLKIGAMSLWSPLVSMRVSPYINNFVVRPVLSFVEKLYQACCGILVGKKYLPGNFADNNLTTDLDKFKLSKSIRFDYSLGSSGVSLKWAIDAIRATKTFKEKNFNNLNIPTFIVKAENDRVVMNNFKYTNKDITDWIAPKAKHALNIENSIIFNEMTGRTFDFFERN